MAAVAVFPRSHAHPGVALWAGEGGGGMKARVAVVVVVQTEAVGTEMLLTEWH